MKRNGTLAAPAIDESLHAAHAELARWLTPFANACDAIDRAVDASAKPLRDALYGNGVEAPRKSLLRPVSLDL